MNQKPRPELILTAWTPPSDPSRTRLIQIGSGPSTSGPRLGGRPPAGVHHPAMQLDCRYFVTVPVCSDPALELSIFVNRDFATLIRSRGQLYRDDRVLLLTHGPSVRAADSPCTSALSEHPLMLGPEVDDCALGDDGELVVDSRHKIGGRPYTIHDPPEFIPGTKEAAQLDMRQYLQFDFPGYGENVSGSWPWGDGLFHVFFRGPIWGAEWAAFWEG